MHRAQYPDKIRDNQAAKSCKVPVQIQSVASSAIRVLSYITKPVIITIRCKDNSIRVKCLRELLPINKEKGKSWSILQELIIFCRYYLYPAILMSAVTFNIIIFLPRVSSILSALNSESTRTTFSLAVPARLARSSRPMFISTGIPG